MVDKDLFLHDLAVVAILKCEGSYLKEWLDYHLLAGVDHFYLYDNESPDNQAEVAKPYIEAGLVDYFSFPGQRKQMPAYNDALRNFYFQCRYMAIIDGDEFIFPKANRSIVEVLDEVFSRDKKVAGLAINWHVFGSNRQDKADYTRGVLERFTRRAHNDYCFPMKGELIGGNPHVKSIFNPRRVTGVHNPHYASYFESLNAVNSNGDIVESFFNKPVLDDKIIINHYFTKSREEFELKVQRGKADGYGTYNAKNFKHNYIEIFDDSILTYRDARAKIYQPPDNSHVIERLLNAVERNLSPTLSANTPPEFYKNKFETFLTCRAVSEYIKDKIADDKYAERLEELSCKAIVKALDISPSVADKRIFMREFPILANVSYPVFNEIRRTGERIVKELNNLNK